MAYKNIIFDLGGVVVARDPKKCTPEFLEFFNYINYDPMPTFWSEYDRGAISFEGVKEALAEFRGVTKEFCDAYVAKTIVMQEEIAPTKELIIKLKERGYKLYVLSNMAHEYINHIRSLDVYKYFDGQVVSCEEGVVKPEARIYEIALERYDLRPSETLFVDDRQMNVVAAQEIGIGGFHFDPTNPALSCARLAEMLFD
ncbi:MAG: HAD family phosphatase [Rikenellaceae bacterium]